MMRPLVLLLAAISVAGCATAPGGVKINGRPALAIDDPMLDPITSREFVRYASEGEFRHYLRTLARLRERRDHAQARQIVVAAVTQGDTTALCEEPEDCPRDDDNVVVTGSTISAPTSITNVQTAGVDEGDIVKQIGDHLLVLQDGRIFVVNVKTMQLTDRVNVYRGNKQDGFEGADWYDEMLVQDDHIIVTAYSYDDDATEMSIFKLDQENGRATSEGVFLITSDDYYDVDNYATRIVGDQLVIYTPYSIEQFEKSESRPVLRRWLPAAERAKRKNEGTPLFDARAIYKPVLRTAEPTIHAISVCPLGDFDRKKNLPCRTTAFVGPDDGLMFVSPDTIYLWTAAIGERDTWDLEDCVKDSDEGKSRPALPRPERRDVSPGALYRLPIGAQDATVAGVSGVPYNHLSMDERDGEFRALVDWRTIRCNGAFDAPAETAFLKIRTAAFSSLFSPVPDRSFTPLPSTGVIVIENRFADDWLVFGGRQRLSGHPPRGDEVPQATKIVAVPVARPRDARTIELPHNVLRAERVGNDIALNGYRDDKGLNVTLIELGKEARVVSTAFLPQRFESEGRSHAFNSVVDEGGNGLIGVPTVKTEPASGRWWWRSRSSDLSFLTKSPEGKLSDAGALIAEPANEIKTHPNYQCDRSCIDWYGNSRPVFIAGRIFGLMGTDLVEARIEQGRISEVARVDLTGPVVSR